MQSRSLSPMRPTAAILNGSYWSYVAAINAPSMGSGRRCTYPLRGLRLDFHLGTLMDHVEVTRRKRIHHFHPHPPRSLLLSQGMRGSRDVWGHGTNISNFISPVTIALLRVTVEHLRLGPCALARSQSSRCGVGARPDGWYLRVRLGKSAAGMVELGSGGSIPARVGRKYSSSGRSLTPTRRPGRVGAYIVGVVDHSYLATWLPLRLTMPSYTSITHVILAVGRTIAGDSALPVPGRPQDHWRPHTCVRPASHVGSTTSAGQLFEEAMMWWPGHHVPYHSFLPREDLLEVPDEGAEDEVLCLAADSMWL
ncbi:hypothetical protein BHE74_00042954 [Ensete ventricosum]|nr:hypothetical protein BHE74_00042954 [Ensete ventricosum]